MVKRILSGIVGITFIISVIILSGNFPVIIDVFVAAVCAIAVGEFANATKTLKLWQISYPSMAFAVLYPMLMVYGAALITGYVYTAIMLSMMIFCHKKISFREFAYIYSMTVIITVSLSTIIQMKNMDASHPAFYFVLTLALPWLADAGAYFAGVTLGKHKLCPEISPKKTVEGAVGGVIIGVAGALADALVFQYIILGQSVKINFVGVAVISLIGVVFAMFGDLTFSIIKRSCKVKDYGNVIPGHGGILDRCDSIIMTAPLLYIFLLYFPLISLT